MSAWGSGGLAKSCDALLRRVENNDPILKEMMVLPMKSFGGPEIERIASALSSSKNTNLTLLSASGHRVPSSSLGVFGNALASGRSNLVRIAVGDNSMGNEGVIALCLPLESVNGGKVESLDLAWKSMSKDGMAAVGRAFGRSKALKELNLSRNHGVGDEGMKEFCSAASRREGTGALFAGLDVLDVSECNVGAEGFEALAGILGGEPRPPLSLNLTSNPLSASSAPPLSHLLCGESKIKELHLSECRLGDDGIEVLVGAILKSPCAGLSLFDLSKNDIGTQGAKRLAASLSMTKGQSCCCCWPTLTELRLAGNPIRSEGTQALANSLNTNSEPQGKSHSVEVLDMSNTSCGRDGALSVLMRCSSLKKLRLFNNKLGLEGLETLADALVQSNLEELDLGGNDAPAASVNQLLDAMAANEAIKTTSLTTLELGGNQTNLEVEQAIQRLQKVSPKLDIARDQPRMRS